jgi:hypothetical protein
MISMKRTVLTWMTSFLLLCGAVQTNWSAEHKVPQFQAGDVFVYDLYWSFLKVGEARLAFSTATIVGSELEALKADFTVRTWGLADTLFKVRDHIQSWIDPTTDDPSITRKSSMKGVPDVTSKSTLIGHSTPPPIETMVTHAMPLASIPTRWTHWH